MQGVRCCSALSIAQSFPMLCGQCSVHCAWWLGMHARLPARACARVLNCQGNSASTQLPLQTTGLARASHLRNSGQAHSFPCSPALTSPRMTRAPSQLLLNSRIDPHVSPLCRVSPSPSSVRRPVCVCSARRAALRRCRGLPPTNLPATSSPECPSLLRARSPHICSLHLLLLLLLFLLLLFLLLLTIFVLFLLHYRPSHTLSATLAQQQSHHPPPSPPIPPPPPLPRPPHLHPHPSFIFRKSPDSACATCRLLPLAPLPPAMPTPLLSLSILPTATSSLTRTGAGGEKLWLLS